MVGGTDTNTTRRKCIQLSDTMGKGLIPSVKSCIVNDADINVKSSRLPVSAARISFRKT